ncbi:hypothetical protein MKW98_025555 [Papaver atlanticum]|uniref:TF-B3 domain-containing protein n=1 Tax=Papaver atlanticum TaxID=357466 RepID=A0AAD4SDW6_9MAGN|nr:hypothetical protein MKW98_025555 [Papaver atlanticum]
MATPRSHNPHFFKVLMQGFEQNLVIPPAFANEQKELMMSKHEKKIAFLRTRKINGDNLWKVEVSRRTDDDEWCFDGDNWSEFVQYHDLKFGEFLVFEHTGELIFNVFIYDHTFCEKGLPRPHTHTRRSHKPRSRAVDDDLQSRSKRNKKPLKSACVPCFTVTMAASNLVFSIPYLNIPTVFANSNNLRESAGSIITLRVRDLKKVKGWPVKLQTFSGDRMCLRDGWSEFVVSNQLRLGDVCLMELDQTARMEQDRIILNVRISRNATSI